MDRGVWWAIVHGVSEELDTGLQPTRLLCFWVVGEDLLGCWAQSLAAPSPSSPTSGLWQIDRKNHNQQIKASVSLQVKLNLRTQRILGVEVGFERVPPEQMLQVGPWLQGSAGGSIWILFCFCF